jgi:hypothetical protein
VLFAMAMAAWLANVSSTAPCLKGDRFVKLWA